MSASGSVIDANNRQLHEDIDPRKDERKWAKDNAQAYVEYCKEKTGRDISADQAQNTLLGNGCS